MFNRWFDGYSGLKYNINAAFAYVALIGLLWTIYHEWICHRLRWRFRFMIALTVCCTFLGEAWGRQLSEELGRVYWFQQNRRRARTAVIWTSALPDNPEIFEAYPFANGFAERVDGMRKAGFIKLPVITEKLRDTVSQLPNVSDNGGGYLDSGVAQDSTHVRVAGWARNPQYGTSADYVVLGWIDPEKGFYPFTAIPTGHSRFDLVTAFNSASMKNAGFEQELNVPRLAKWPLVIKAWAVDVKRQEAFPVGGALQIERPSP